MHVRRPRACQCHALQPLTRLAVLVCDLQDSGVFNQKPQSRSMTEAMATDPTMMVDMMKKNLTGVVPQVSRQSSSFPGRGGARCPSLGPLRHRVRLQGQQPPGQSPHGVQGPVAVSATMQASCGGMGTCRSCCSGGSGSRGECSRSRGGIGCLADTCGYWRGCMPARGPHVRVMQPLQFLHGSACSHTAAAGLLQTAPHSRSTTTLCHPHMPHATHNATQLAMGTVVNFPLTATSSP